MAFTMSMSGRRCPFFGGMIHAQNFFTAQCSHMALETPALSSVYDDDDGEEEEETAAEPACYAGWAMFATPAMRKTMETLGTLHRQRQQATQPPPENGNSAVVVPRPRLEPRLAAAAPRLSMLRYAAVFC
ncbi:hypothetical protein C2845_PM12G11320 [Panicum miliaceum]|uniref:Uncharacterized protein n=1 Tax=Panicum miliaceum TaxID=4540 RepID=A0A3L6QDD5_PANMI|nr:hypothetical protein C2845_PM12G11320 [Panicum miliaceum]